MMVILDFQLGEIQNHRPPMGISVRASPERFNQAGKARPDCEKHYPMGGNPRISKKLKSVKYLHLPLCFLAVDAAASSVFSQGFHTTMAHTVSQNKASLLQLFLVRYLSTERRKSTGADAMTQWAKCLQ